MLFVMGVEVILSKDSEMGATNSASNTDCDFYLMIYGISFHGVGLHSMSDIYKWHILSLHFIFLICKLGEISFPRVETQNINGWYGRCTGLSEGCWL